MNRQELIDQALDAALTRVLKTPELPADFRQQLRAAIARHPAADSATLRAQLEREHRTQLAELRCGYVRVRQRTLGSLLAAAFATGLFIALALPWLQAHFGPNGVFALPVIGAVVGIGLSLRAWWQGSSLERRLS